MKNFLFLPALFFSVIILQLIPYTREVEISENTYLIKEGLLPNLLGFSLICGVVLIIALTVAIAKLRKKLSGQLIIKRKYWTLKHEFSILIFWTAFLLPTYFLQQGTNTIAYYLIILCTAALYELFKKLYVKIKTPDFLSIEDESIYYKRIWGKAEREMKNLQSIFLDNKQNALTLIFKEGLENIKIHLADFEIDDIRKMIEKVKATKGANLTFNETFIKYYEH